MLTKLLLRICSLINALSSIVGALTGFLAFSLVVLTVYDVILRYFFSAGSIKVQELEWHVFAVMFLLGAGFTLQRDAHVRVDVIYGRLPERAKATINVLGTLCFLLPFCALVVWTSIDFVKLAYPNEGSPDPGGLPYRYLVKSAIPLGFSLLALQGVAFLIENLLTLFGARVGSSKDKSSESSP